MLIIRNYRKLLQEGIQAQYFLEVVRQCEESQTGKEKGYKLVYIHTLIFTTVTYIHFYYIHLYNTHIHTYIHTFIQSVFTTYVRTYIHTYIHTYIYTYSTYIHTYPNGTARTSVLNRRVS